MFARHFKLLFVYCILYSASLYALETPSLQPDTITLIRKSEEALKSYLKRPYKVVRGDTMPGEIIGEYFQYEVKPNDTLLKIALKFDVSCMSIVYANPNKSFSIIYPGNKFIIPKWMIVPKKLYKGLLINLPEYRLYLFDNNSVVKVYPICIGLASWRTLQGKFKIKEKSINPSWLIPEEMAARLMKPQEIVPPGDTNPLGDRWIGLSLPNTGIHSTIDTMSIGRASSHGCIRLYPKDIHKLFDIVKVGDIGEIIYEPIKIAVVGHKIFMEVHRDIYKLIPQMKDEAIRRLEIIGLKDFIDETKVTEVVKECRGVPIRIGTIK